MRIPFAPPTGGQNLQQNLPAGTVTAVFAQAFSTASGGRKQAMLQELFLNPGSLATGSRLHPKGGPGMLNFEW